MKCRYLLYVLLFLFANMNTNAQQKVNFKDGYPNNVNPIGIVKNIPDATLLEIVQRQTFRFFWHGAHPVSGLALERSNTVLAEHYWDYINEAWDEPNFSKTTFGPDAGAIGGTGFRELPRPDRAWRHRRGCGAVL